jgi:excisionase family DNA binding protein
MGELISISQSHKPLVKAEVVAHQLSCSEAHILRLARAGKIPARPINNGSRKHWRFDLDEVVNFLEAKTASA